MLFGVLGPLEVRRDGILVDVGGPKQQALLTLMLLRANQFLATDWLTDALWDGRPPASAETTLRTYVAGLRRALEPSRGHRSPSEILRGRAGGYELRVTPDDLDVIHFERLITQQRFAEALRLWRGEPLAAVADLAAARPERERLLELRLSAEEGLLRADQGPAVIAPLLRFVAEHPTREAARAELMLALYRAGRQPEALEVYAEGHRVLADQYGVEPGARLRELQRRILRQEPVDGRTAGAPVDAGPAVRSAEPTVETGLVGRAAESAVLVDRLATAERGTGCAVVISGEPGIGKTSLARALEEHAGARNVPVVWGRCPDVGQAPPFWLWSRVVRRLLDLAGDAAPPALDPLLLDDPRDTARRTSRRDAINQPARTGTNHQPARHRASGRPASDAAGRPASDAASDRLGRVHGGPTPHGTGDGLDATARFQLYDAVAQLVEAAAHDHGLVLVLDDLHAADPDSLLLLRFLATTLAGTRALVVATTRPYEHRPGLLATVSELVRDPASTRLPLPGLDHDAVRRLVRRARGAPPDEEYISDLVTRTAGNPFFITELLRHATGEALPPTVRDAVRVRLCTVDESTTECLELLSVAGHELDPHTLASVLGTSTDAVVARLSGAAATQLVGPVGAGQVGFRHPLFAEVAYAEIPPPRRAALHARLAGAYERLGAFPAAEIAHHFGHAVGLGHGDDHVRWSLRAADEATRRLAYEDAFAHLDRAAARLATLSANSPAAAATELTVHLRRAALSQGVVGIGSEAVNDACVRARALLSLVAADADIRPALWTLAELAANRAEYDICADLASRIAHAPGPPDDITVAAGEYELGAVAYFTGRLADAEAHLSAAVERLAALDPRTPALRMSSHPALAAHNFRALVRSLRGQADAARRDLADAAELAERVDDPYARANAQLYASWLGLQERDVAFASAAARRCRALGVEHRLPHFVATGDFFAAWAAVLEGDRSRLAAMRDGYEAIYRLGLRATRSITLAGMAEAHVVAQDPDGARRVVDEGLRIADEVGERVFVAELLRIRGCLDDDPATLREAARIATDQGAHLIAQRLPGPLLTGPLPPGPLSPGPLSPGPGSCGDRTPQDLHSAPL